MDRLYDNIDEAKAFSLSFTNFVYFYDDVCLDDFQTIVCKECGRFVQDKDYLFPKANCKKPSGILHTYEFGVSQELRNELIAQFDITAEDFRPIRSKKGEVIYYQITPQNVMLPIHEENEWHVHKVCPRCGSIQYEAPWKYNDKDEPYGYISQNAFENMHDLNVTCESLRRHMPLYLVSRRVYEFLTERYPRTHFIPFFLK